jgi:hypothetical protein
VKEEEEEERGRETGTHNILDCSYSSAGTLERLRRRMRSRFDDVLRDEVGKGDDAVNIAVDVYVAEKEARVMGEDDEGERLNKEKKGGRTSSAHQRRQRSAPSRTQHDAVLESLHPQPAPFWKSSNSPNDPHVTGIDNRASSEDDLSFEVERRVWRFRTANTDVDLFGSEESICEDGKSQ